jgi:hypothetical protein
MMMKNVFLVVLACFQLVPCAATVNIQQEPSSSDDDDEQQEPSPPSDDDEYEYTLLVDFSMLSESCANETIDVIRKLDLLPYSWTCSGLNETHGGCELEYFGVEDYQYSCNASSGKFYSDSNVGDELYHLCVSFVINDDGEKVYWTNVTVAHYPFCAGSSCNKSEILMAYDAMLRAEGVTGQLQELSDRVCTFIPVWLPTSIAYNRYTYGSIIYSTLAMVYIVVLLTL